jgi:hypothetical protein
MAQAVVQADGKRDGLEGGFADLPLADRFAFKIPNVGLKTRCSYVNGKQHLFILA